MSQEGQNWRILRREGNHRCNSKPAFVASSWVDFVIQGHRLQIRPPTSRDRAAGRPSHETVQYLSVRPEANTRMDLDKHIQKFQVTETLRMTAVGRGVTDG
jgi:hypothetical protein